ncbi:copper resistance CopC family protein [Jonesiaceae bacterium BS-20]|uniref:Copper resistance CopC family protein n=1 Tax=Jonesiaceae bacterium BS-20 TaxID=3120821 RepID=A0AAU7DX66_9MICO
MHIEFPSRAVPVSNKPTTQAVAAVPVKKFGTLLAAFFLALALVVVSAQQAFAHDYLMASNPEDGATLEAQPSQVVLSFNNDIQKLGAQIVILDENETPIASGAPVVEGKNASYKVPEALGNGSFTVNWRVVSSDSHPIDGSISYTVEGEDEVSAPPAETPPSPEETAAEGETSEPSATADGEATGNDSGEQAQEEKAPLPWTGIIIGGVLGLTAGIVLMILGKRKKKND